eukprot:scaffold86249_cov17-Tisochrysis_lutea.AAC.1
MSQASLQILFAHTVPGSSQYLVNCATPAGKLLKVQPVQQESDFVMSLHAKLAEQCRHRDEANEDVSGIQGCSLQWAQPRLQLSSLERKCKSPKYAAKPQTGAILRVPCPC